MKMTEERYKQLPDILKHDIEEAEYLRDIYVRGGYWNNENCH